MRVGVVCSSVGTVVAGGVETYVREVYSRISGEEDITVITGKGKEPDDFKKFKKKVKTYEYPFISRHNPMSRFLVRLGLSIYDDEVEVLSLLPFVFIHLLFHRYDKVVVTNPFFIPIVKFFKMRCVFINQGSVGKKKYFFLRTFKPDISISCSDCIRRDLLGKFGIDSEVIYNGVNLGDFRKSGSRIRKRYGIKKKYTMMLAVGRFVDWKNFDILIKFFSKLPENNKLLLIGDGVEKENLMKLVSELGLEKRVIFVGIVGRDVIPLYFAASDVFALMSKGEAFGVVFVEAMASGKPIITYNAGAAPEIMDETFALLLNRKDGIETIAEKVARFLKKDLKKMGALAKRRAEEFTWDIAAKGTREVLKRTQS